MGKLISPISTRSPGNIIAIVERLPFQWEVISGGVKITDASPENFERNALKDATCSIHNQGTILSDRAAERLFNGDTRLESISFDLYSNYGHERSVSREALKSVILEYLKYNYSCVLAFRMENTGNPDKLPQASHEYYLRYDPTGGSDTCYLAMEWREHLQGSKQVFEKMIELCNSLGQVVREQ